MTSHNWGDPDVDWKGINDAAHYISSFCRRWGRLGGIAKEKYGTVRFYVSFGYLSLHTLFYPGYASYQFPKWLIRLDQNWIGPSLDRVFGRLFHRWQRFIYSTAYHRACRKWPHLREEILCCADWPEFLGDLGKEYLPE